MRVTITRAFEVGTFRPTPHLPANISTPPIASPCPTSPLSWWRTRPPGEFTRKDSAALRWALLGKQINDEASWRDAATGEVTAAIRVVVGRLKKREITHPEIDLALTAMLACAVDGDVTSGILISSALRRRSEVDPHCRSLSDLWLIADF